MITQPRNTFQRRDMSIIIKNQAHSNSYHFSCHSYLDLFNSTPEHSFYQSYSHPKQKMIGFSPKSTYAQSLSPGSLQIIITVVCILSILLPRGLIRLSSGAIILSLFLYTINFTTDPSRGSYLAGVSCAGLTLRWIDLVGIHVPERDFWEKGSNKKDSPKTSFERLKWFIYLWNSQRGVGWNIEPDCLPAAHRPHCTRSMFVKDSLLAAFKAYLGFDVTQAILQTYHATEKNLFFEMSLPKQIFIAWAAAFKLFYSIALLYAIGSGLAVVVGAYQPVDWPPIFGSFKKDAWSIRKMWGSCWHQLMRRPCAEGGKVVKSYCGFRTGSFTSRYSQIWVGFAVSAAIHHAGAIVSMLDNSRWQVFYFCIQPMGIMI
ncbi:hypothetical protein ONS95_004646 [Cadophora gregata]|uniref:uncharacterized protein n=1 Tax=Cadophora gregata TaxID=51156 RepID=UPI0026DD569D|nr:uncharacterized protein ONS95_004646 [Cadophora gregata]KAK0104984.1 hypothetical protein ONS96_004392 [Cadophora gregata f. sp. sojae]KAK0106144.1 hypothetical protein ONS95_004646 [Cadophora gregata]